MICTKCNGDFSTKQNRLRHEKKCKQWYCHHCDKIFNSRSSYDRHVKAQSTDIIKFYKINYAQKDIIDKQLASTESKIKKLSNDNQSLTTKNSTLLSENKTLKEHNDDLEQQLEDSKYVPGVYTNTIKYLNKMCDLSPQLSSLNDYSVIKDSLSTKLFIEKIIDEFEQQQLSSYIGNIIVDHYKKTKNQSMWVTDITRLTLYIMNKDEPSKWCVDNKGIIVKQYVIKPLLRYITKLLQKYNIDLDNRLNTHQNNLKKTKEINSIRVTIDKIINKINKFADNDIIIKYIAPFFKLNR